MLIVFVIATVLSVIGVILNVIRKDREGAGFFTLLTIMFFTVIVIAPINTVSKKEVNCKVHHCRTVSVIEYNGDPIITDSSYYVGKRDTVIVKITKKQGIIPFKTKIEYEVLK